MSVINEAVLSRKCELLQVETKNFCTPFRLEYVVIVNNIVINKTTPYFFDTSRAPFISIGIPTSKLVKGVDSFALSREVILSP